jgi:hypothetical protein
MDGGMVWGVGWAERASGPVRAAPVAAAAEVPRKSRLEIMAKLREVRYVGVLRKRAS